MRAVTVSRERRLVMALVIGSTLFSLAVAEAFLRWRGREPWRYSDVDRHEPRLYEEDAELGWRNREGAHRFPTYNGDGGTIVHTIWRPGLRATAPAPPPASKPTVLFIGDSITEGHAISDWETYPWKVQEAFPEWRVLNLGTGGYSTYQSYLAMLRYLEDEGRVDIVIYGYLPFHLERNVASAAWLRLLRTFKNRGPAAIPYVTLNEQGGLRFHAPDRYPVFPLADRLAVARLVGDSLAKRRFPPRWRERERVMVELLRMMVREGNSRGAKVAVLNLSAKPFNNLEAVQRGTKPDAFAFFECGIQITSDLQVEAEGHPNGAANTHWSACVTRLLRQQSWLEH